MARLNEPPIAPAAASASAVGCGESLDARESSTFHETTSAIAHVCGEMPRTKSMPTKREEPADLAEVKRRFVRQNRELARNNSSQSLRIRSLEVENGRLSAENFELRAQIHEMQMVQKKATVARIKHSLKEKMEEMMQQVLGEVLDYDTIHKDIILDPSNRQYRDRQPLGELMRDTAMPIITEGKSYPRRTLNADEIRAIRLSEHGSNGSPDPGPPPVVHFDMAEPMGYDAPVEEIGETAELPKLQDDAVTPQDLPINLETRRKRRTLDTKVEENDASVSADPSAKQSEEAPISVFRKAAKRKLADREGEKPTKPTASVEFTFTRRPSTKLVEPSMTTAELASKLDQNALSNSPSRTRKVLADKSVNLSPKKSERIKDKSTKDEPLKKPAAPRFSAPVDASAVRKRRVSSMVTFLPEDPAPATETAPPDGIHDVQVPTTPVDDDFFSPAASIPSTRLVEKCDTPPPADLHATTNTTDATQRPSRRARSAAVNYGEPSLRAKMRRPDSKMVDALSGLQDPRSVMSTKPRKSGVSSRMSIKQEPEQDALPPYGNIESIQLEGLNTEKNGDDAHAQPAEVRATSDISRQERRVPRTANDYGSMIPSPTAPSDTVASKMEELDLYEFKESSSPTTETRAHALKGDPARTRTHRRHSSMPRDISKKDTGPLSGSDAVAAKSDAAVRAANRRKSMML